MYGLIGVLIRGLLGGLMISLPTLLKRAAIALGFGVITFTGTTIVLNHLKDVAFANLSGVPSMALNIFGILNIDTAFSIVMSAYAIKLTMKSLGGLNPKQIGLF